MAGYTDEYDLMPDDDHVGEPVRITSEWNFQTEKSEKDAVVDPLIETKLSVHKEDDVDVQYNYTVSKPIPEGRKARVLFLRSHRLSSLTQRCSFHEDRSLLTNALIDSIILGGENNVDGLDEMDDDQCEQARSKLSDVVEEDIMPVNVESLYSYHSTGYISAIALQKRIRSRERQAYGLLDDCSPFQGMLEYCCYVAGGSLQAARSISEGQCKVAVHLEGGRHHAKKSSASGFCFVNDVILCILDLLKSYERVLYIDIDIHHADAVQEAFIASDRVLTISLHHHAPGFFPGSSSGACGSFGQGKGAGYALNLTLNEGLKDCLFYQSFERLLMGAISIYSPNAVVLQAGCDGLAGDPVGQYWMLSPLSFYRIGKLMGELIVPSIILGGGGYNATSVACAWTSMMYGLVKPEQNLSDGLEIPVHEHIDRYAPYYNLFYPRMPTLLEEKNDSDKVASTITNMLNDLKLTVEASACQGRSGKRFRSFCSEPYNAINENE